MTSGSNDGAEAQEQPDASDTTETEGRDVSGDLPTSGQSCWQKIQFACSLISAMSSGSVLFFAKDVYVLELGANVGFMGVAGTLLAVWGPFCYPFAGYVMDRDYLQRCFPWSTWGRRAPWQLTHVIGAAIAAAAVYFVPVRDTTGMCVWYLIFGVFLCWFLAVLFTAFEAGRAEMYPLKEERSEVEAFTKCTAGIGTGLGMVPQLWVMASATAANMSMSGAFLLVVGCISLMSVPVLRTARQPYEPPKQGIFSELLSVTRSRAMRHLMLYRFVEGLSLTVLSSAAIYWLTLVEGFHGGKRSLYIVVLGVILGVATVLLLPVWTQFFRKRRKGLNASVVPAAVVFVGVCAALFLYVLTALEVTKPVPLFIYLTILQLTLTGQTFWRAVVLGWVVDEDCQAVVGRRREAAFVGATALVGALGRAAAVGVVLNGLAAAGMSMKNCNQECNNSGLGQGEDACVEACEKSNIASQPESVRTYLKVLYYAVVPVGQLVLAGLTYSFPIYGARLDRIYQQQKQLFVPTQAAASLEAPTFVPVAVPVAVLGAPVAAVDNEEAT